MQLLEIRQQDPPKLCWDASPDAARVHQVAALEVPDRDRIEHFAIWDVTADNEVLSAVGAPLEPTAAALARAV
jgi:hypothetical protein